MKHKAGAVAVQPRPLACDWPFKKRLRSLCFTSPLPLRSTPLRATSAPRDTLLLQGAGRPKDKQTGFRPRAPSGAGSDGGGGGARAARVA